jgi:hypothetical protein
MKAEGRKDEVKAVEALPSSFRLPSPGVEVLKSFDS